MQQPIKPPIPLLRITANHPSWQPVPVRPTTRLLSVFFMSPEANNYVSNADARARANVKRATPSGK